MHRQQDNLGASSPSFRRKLKEDISKRQKFQRKLQNLRFLHDYQWLSSWTGTVFQKSWKAAILAAFVALLVTVVHMNGIYNFDWELVAWQASMAPIGFLLVFRTAVSYRRYWDGSQALDEVLLSARSLVRHHVAYSETNSSARLNKNLVSLLRAFFVCLRWDVQSQLRDPDFSDLAPHVSKKQADFLRESKRKPVVLLMWISQNTRAIALENDYSVYQAVAVQKDVDFLQSSWMSMNKITFTPIPFPYTQFSKVLLALWCNTVGVGLVQKWKYLTPIAVFFLAFAVQGLVQAGIEVEYPFGVDYNNFLLEEFDQTLSEDIYTLTTSTAPSWSRTGEDQETLRGRRKKGTRMRAKAAQAKPVEDLGVRRKATPETYTNGGWVQSVDDAARVSANREKPEANMSVGSFTLPQHLTRPQSQQPPVAMPSPMESLAEKRDFSDNVEDALRRALE